MSDNLPAAELIPPDPKQCQARIRPAHGPFVLGPRPKYQRCSAKPTVIVTENKPGKDGLIGSMSLCPSCLQQLLKDLGNDFIVEAIP